MERIAEMVAILPLSAVSIVHNGPHIRTEINNNAMFSSDLLYQSSQIGNKTRKHRAIFLIVREKIVLSPIQNKAVDFIMAFRLMKTSISDVLVFYESTPIPSQVVLQNFMYGTCQLF